MRELEAMDTRTGGEIQERLSTVGQLNQQLSLLREMLARAERDGGEVMVAAPVDNEAERQEREDAEAARRAFEFARRHQDLEEVVEEDEAEAAGAAGSVSSSSVASTSGTNGKLNGASASSVPTEATKPAAAAPSTDTPAPSFKRVVKKKKDHSALLGIKKKPSLV